MRAVMGDGLTETGWFKINLWCAICGVAIGDALGVPAEFKSRKTLAQNPVTDMIEGYRPKGTYSDDTAMTLCTLASLQENNWNLNPYDIMGRFLRWVDEGYMAVDGDVFDVGVTTRRAIARFKNKIPLEKCGSTNFYECGNGSLMRIMPIVFYLQKHPEADVYETVKLISSLTHAHDVCIVGCYIYVRLCLAILNNKTLAGKRKLFVRELSKIKDEISCRVDKKWVDLYARIFDFKNFRKLKAKDIKSDGYIVSSLEAALWCFLTTKDYRTCVLKAINLGSDSDTTAAIAGGIAGLYHGPLGDVPLCENEWYMALRNREVIDELRALEPSERKEYVVVYSTPVRWEGMSKKESIYG